MFETLSAQIGAAIMIAICGCAFWKGDEPERVVAGTYVLAWFATLISQTEMGVQAGLTLVAGIDLVLLGVIAAMTWRSRKTWLIWACALQLLIVISHVLAMADMRASIGSFLAIINLASYGLLLTLAIGTFWAWQERRAAGLD